MAKMLSCSVAAPALTGETLYITCLCAESRQVGGTDDEHSETRTDICARSLETAAEVAGLQGSSLSLSLINWPSCSLPHGGFPRKSVAKEEGQGVGPTPATA